MLRKAKSRKRREAEARNRAYAALKNHRKRIAELDAQMERDNARMKELLDLMADPDFYINEDASSDAVAEHALLKKRIFQAEEEWFVLPKNLRPKWSVRARCSFAHALRLWTRRALDRKLSYTERTDATPMTEPLNIVLVEPEIPQNTGNIARTCACLGARLHLVEPMGFRLTERNIKRRPDATIGTRLKSFAGRARARFSTLTRMTSCIFLQAMRRRHIPTCRMRRARILSSGERAGGLTKKSSHGTNLRACAFRCAMVSGASI